MFKLNLRREYTLANKQNDKLIIVYICNVSKSKSLMHPVAIFDKSSLIDSNQTIKDYLIQLAENEIIKYVNGFSKKDVLDFDNDFIKNHQKFFNYVFVDEINKNTYTLDGCNV